jgi:hypothetical protein
MLRATKGKIAEREKLLSDYEQWLAAGNTPIELPGFGISRTHISNFNDLNKNRASASANKVNASLGGQASGVSRKRHEGY